MFTLLSLRRKGETVKRAMLFGPGERFEAKILVDDKGVQEYVDADSTWVRVRAHRQDAALALHMHS